MKRSLEILLVSFLCFSTYVGAKNISDKYVDEYKKYLNAKCPIEKDKIKHFVYFAKDREAIHGHPFLKVARFKGAQIMYSWADLETS